MRVMTALVKREFLEHRIAFLYAPALLLLAVSLAVLLAFVSGHAEVEEPSGGLPITQKLYLVGVAANFFLWSGYLLIALVFYYADSFSADRRNNALLFWKSMPQSDLKVLTSKALAGITVFLALILGFAVLSAVVLYPLLLVGAARHPMIAVPGLGEAALVLLQMTLVGGAYLVLILLWYAPMLAWIAGLSTHFRRWSIPLAFLIPAAVVLLERIIAISGTGAERPIGTYLVWRFERFPEPVEAATILIGQTDGGPFTLLSHILSNIDWLQMATGLIFTAGILYLASEYRRRRIEA